MSQEGKVIVITSGKGGVGKTTTIGKLASRLQAQGKKVVVGAADTFRAAAVDQLTIWAERAGCDIIKHAEGADPAAVVFDAMKAAIARKADILFIDTAGRLQIDTDMMAELMILDRTFNPHEKLLVIDALTGQEAVKEEGNNFWVQGCATNNEEA